jgi:beta-N-acetylhexosaminidase
VNGRRYALGSVAVAAALSMAGSVSGQPSASPPPPLEQLVGQRLVIALKGTSASPALLSRIRTGRVGGVILFGANVRSPDQVRALTASIRAAAAAGHQLRPLVLVDQEGGGTRRFLWAPPSLSAAQLGSGTLSSARAEGRATAAALLVLGVDVDLAPVVDVPHVQGSFIAQQARAFSTDPRLVSALATSFARGLADGGIAATAKHFPGLGGAQVSTDVSAVTIRESHARLEADLIPYRSLIAAGVPLVMLSSATYTTLDAKPAAWSPAAERLLRGELGFSGVTITDALDAAGPTHGRSLASAAVLAAQAGVDLLLVTGSEAESDVVFQRLLAAAQDGRIPARSLAWSYSRIAALKAAISARG